MVNFPTNFQRINQKVRRNRMERRLLQRRISRAPTFFTPPEMVWESDSWISLSCYMKRNMEVPA